MFIRDLIHLPKKLEHEFTEKQVSLVFPNEPSMIISQGTKDFTIRLFERIFGYNPDQVLAEQKQQAEGLLVKERQKAEANRQKAEQERHTTILQLHQLAQMDIPQIAEIMRMTEVEVREILDELVSLEKE